MTESEPEKESRPSPPTSTDPAEVVLPENETNEDEVNLAVLVNIEGGGWQLLLGLKFDFASGVHAADYSSKSLSSLEKSKNSH